MACVRVELTLSQQMDEFPSGGDIFPQRRQSVKTEPPQRALERGPDVQTQFGFSADRLIGFLLSRRAPCLRPFGCSGDFGEVGGT